MSLAKRIIATILVRDGQQVVSRQFDPWRTVGHPEQAVRVHNARNVDEIIILDIGAGEAGPDFEQCERLTEQAFMPVTYGGGVRGLDDVRGLLRAGADKVAVGAAKEFPGIKAAADVLGRQAIVGVHVYRTDQCGGIYRPILRNVGEVLVLHPRLDGMMGGYGLGAIEYMREEFDGPVVAGSGCGTYEHMHEALDAGADAVAAGAMWVFRDATPRGAAEYLARRGWEVRT